MTKKLITVALLIYLVCLSTWSIAGQGTEKGTEKKATAPQNSDQKMDAASFVQQFAEPLKARDKAKMEGLVRQAGADIVYKTVISQAKKGISSIAEGKDGSVPFNTAEAMAAAYARVYKNEGLVDLVRKYMLYSQEMCKERLKGDELIDEGISIYKKSQWKDAEYKWAEALKVFRKIGDVEGEAKALTNIGNVYKYLGQYAEALSYYQQALAIYRKIGSVAEGAAALGNIGVVYYSLGPISDVKYRVLRYAVQCGQIEVIKTMLAAGAYYNEATYALPDAVEMAGHYKNSIKIVELLLNWGADPNRIRIVNDITLLMMAADHGNITLVQLLLDHCADVSAQDADGRTALYWTEKKTHEKIKKLLEESICSPPVSKLPIPADLSEEIRKEIGNLQSTSPKTRMIAADNLGAMGPKAAPALPFLLQNLCDVSPEAYESAGIRAAHALTNIGQAAVNPLIIALGSRKSCVRANAVVALANMQDPRIEDALLKALKDRNSQVRQSAARAFASELSHFATPHAVPGLIESLKDEHRYVQESAIEGLKRLNDPRAVVPLITLLREGKDVLVKDRAVDALYLIKTSDPKTIVFLIDALKDKGHWVRRGAIAALISVDSPQIIEPLLFALKDNDNGVCGYAARKLGGMKESKAIEPLIELLETAHDWDKIEAADALKKITEEDFGEDPAQWRAWWEKKKTTEKGKMQTP